MSERPLPQIALKERREVTIAKLCEHFAQDRLELAEFEARLDLAHRALSVQDLDALLADLSAAAPAEPAPPPARSAMARGASAIGEAVRASRTYLAVMGGLERRGPWTPARRNVIVAVMGGVELDFREVDLPPGETEVFLFCMMGGAEIIVPPGLAVDASGIAIMGGFGHTTPGGRADPDAPVLRVTGVCIMGGADISFRYEGETARDASRRTKEERRQLRETRRLRDGGEGQK